MVSNEACVQRLTDSAREVEIQERAVRVIKYEQ